jgi:hypothetical protein
MSFILFPASEVIETRAAQQIKPALPARTSDE